MIFRSFKSPASGKENVRFPDCPDFENLQDFRTGRDVRLSPTISSEDITPTIILDLLSIAKESNDQEISERKCLKKEF